MLSSLTSWLGWLWMFSRVQRSFIYSTLLPAIFPEIIARSKVSPNSEDFSFYFFNKIKISGFIET
jgi:hypothetical protein